jgi:DNA-binding transcriptional regulator YdaS (Cro superfamily)
MPSEINSQDLVRRAIERFGSQARLAARMGCSQQQIAYMLTAARVSAEMAAKIDAATDGLVSKHDLRPDIFGTVHAKTPDATAPDVGVP